MRSAIEESIQPFEKELNKRYEASCAGDTGSDFHKRSQPTQNITLDSAQMGSNRGEDNINPNFLSEIEQQTNEAQQLLTSIFSDATSETTDNNETGTTAVEYEILKCLFAKEIWSKDEFVKICRQYDVIPSAIIERINNISYDKINDAVIEDEGDTITITLEYKDELL
jgi:hypothetical protein